MHAHTLSIDLCFADFPEAKLKEAKQAFLTAAFDCWETTIGSNGVLAHNYFSTP